MINIKNKTFLIKSRIEHHYTSSDIFNVDYNQARFESTIFLTMARFGSFNIADLST